MWMWMSVGNRERRHFRSNGVSSCRRVRDVFQMMSCCCWTIDDNNNDTSCWDVTRVDCPTLGFSPFFLLLRKLVATGQYIKKYIEEYVYWGLLSRLHPCDGTDPFHVVVFFPWERESSRAAAAGGRCTARSPFTYCCRCLLSHASNISLSFSLWAKRFQIYTIWWISILIVLLHQPQKHTKLLLFFLSTSICLFDCRTNQIRTS
jgi:hypothetical protein